MLSNFDWVRRSRSGAELLAILFYIEECPDFFLFDEEKIGLVHSALTGPCQRCWIYPRVDDSPYCIHCKVILNRGRGLSRISRNTILIWGYLNQLPGQLETFRKNRKGYLLTTYLHDQNHFLIALLRRNLKPWLQDLAMHEGYNLRGTLQIVPTVGPKRNNVMGDIICRLDHYESILPMDRLWIRFYSNPYDSLAPHLRDKKGLLSFEIAEFLSLLDTAAIFRTLLRPEEQRAIAELMKIKEDQERHFYWGRFLGNLDQKAKDMITAWDLRRWPWNRVQLLYELIDYVEFSQSN
ncbi:MAG: hypothetical protein V1872_07840 [bacterium]